LHTHLVLARLELLLTVLQLLAEVLDLILQLQQTQGRVSSTSTQNDGCGAAKAEQRDQGNTAQKE
jgi:hypothetical protein